MTVTKLSHLIAARILHDIATPVSAASMGVSALSQDPHDTQALDIAEQSLHRLQSLMGLLRMLFATEEPLPWGQVQRLLQTYMDLHQVQLTCTSSFLTSDLWVRLLPFLGLMGIEVLAGPGDLDVMWTKSTLTLQGRSTGRALSTLSLEMLGHHTELSSFSPRSIHLYMINKMLHAHHLQVHTHAHGGAFEVMVSR